MGMDCGPDLRRSCTEGQSPGIDATIAADQDSGSVTDRQYPPV